MIEIAFKDGNFITYKSEEYTDYIYDGKMFIVIFDKQWIGFYNMEYIMYIEIERAKHDE